MNHKPPFEIRNPLPRPPIANCSKSSIRHSLRLLVLALAFCADTLAGPSAHGADKPNVVLFFVDDQSWVGTSVQMRPDDPETKSDFFETPALEAMAASGMRFTDAYSTAPVCCPSRTALEFGQTAARTRVTFNARNNSTGPGRSIAQTLAPAGYICGRYGKTGVDHISADELGYVEQRVWRGNTAGDYDDVPVGDHVSANKKPLPPDNPKRTPEITRCGLEFLDRRAKDEQPFFLYLSYFAVHVDSQATPETIAKYQAKKPGVKHADIVYAAMTEELDNALGAVRAKLRELGLERNTVLIYTSDNGGQYLKQGHTTSGKECDTLNLPLSGWKATLDEGGIRVPFLVEGPGIAANAVSKVPVGGSDILPTIADLAGVASADDVDGGSLLPVLRGGGQGEVNRRNAPGLVWHQPWRSASVNYPTSSALRIGDWKYLRKWTEPAGHLYNMATDYHEQHNLAARHPERTAAMQAALDEYLKKVNAEPALPERWGNRRLEKQGKPLDPVPTGDN